MTDRQGAAPVIAVTGMAFEARIARAPGVEVVYAARGALLERALEDALARGASGVISFGTAGGLATDLPAGTVVVADAIDGPAGRIATHPAWHARLATTLRASSIGAHVRCGALAAVVAPVVGVEQKRALHLQSRALAVDMESHIAAAMAGERGLPFVACRVVVDPAWRALPPAAIAGLREDGTTALLPILASLIRAPAQIGPMIQLAADARAARAALVAVRRVVGARFGLS